MLRGRGLAKLFAFFFDFLEPYIRMRAWSQLQGNDINTYRRDIVDAALKAAKAMPPTAVRVVDAAAGSCMVQSGSGQPGEYRVQAALGVDPTCTCPVGRGGMFCKHVAGVHARNGRRGAGRAASARHPPWNACRPCVGR